MDWGELPKPVRLRLQAYFREQGVTDFQTVDVLLGLLRLNEVALAERVWGRPVTRCPPGIPRWPPKPARREAAQPKVASKASPNPCLNGTAMRSRFEAVRVGMTLPQLMALGLSRRDIRYLTNLGRLKWTETE